MSSRKIMGFFFFNGRELCGGRWFNLILVRFHELFSFRLMFTEEREWGKTAWLILSPFAMERIYDSSSRQSALLFFSREPMRAYRGCLWNVRACVSVRACLRVFMSLHVWACLRTYVCARMYVYLCACVSVYMELVEFVRRFSSYRNIEKIQ